METAFMKNALPGKDHQAALGIINQLGDCQTREQINQILKTSLIPLMGSSGAFYARLEGEHNTPRLLDTINPSSLCQCQWRYCLKVATQGHLVNHVLADEKTLPLTTEDYSCINQICQYCPIHPSNSCDIEHRCCAITVLCDSPNPSIALYFYRFTPHSQYYNLRDIELLQLLRATLLQTIKAVIFQEQYHTLQHVLNYISDHAEPLAVVRLNGGLVYKNLALDQAVGQDKCARLLTLLAQKTTKRPDDNGYNNNLSRLGRRLYEVSLTPINTADHENAELRLLRFTRVADKKRQIMRNLEKAGLTSRELEIAALIYQGISTRNISEQINLSYHTIRNHIKHIYCKIGVSTRSEMMTWVG